jgi:hypothetical protein
VEHLDIGFSKELTAGVLHDLRPTVTSAETVVYANTDLLIAATFFVEDDSRKLDAEVLSVGTHAITKTSGVETVFTLLGEVLAGGVPIESKKLWSQRVQSLSTLKEQRNKSVRQPCHLK